jgi:NADH:ubiquinone oxidoreductase subunit 6 (subunit J)
VIGLKASGSLAHSAHIGGSFGSPAEIGRLFLTDHLLAFEVTSIVLLVAAVGGVILGSHARRLPWGSADAEAPHASLPAEEPSGVR